jgi:hypothetical protein
MYQSTQIPETVQIKQGLKRVGLNISDSELQAILTGKPVSLESRCLSELGSLFILASAISQVTFGKKKKTITFGDLEHVTEVPRCQGIPLYSWTSDALGQCCVNLTLVSGKPRIVTYCENINSHANYIKSA